MTRRFFMSKFPAEFNYMGRKTLQLPKSCIALVVLHIYHNFSRFGLGFWRFCVLLKKTQNELYRRKFIVIARTPTRKNRGIYIDPPLSLINHGGGLFMGTGLKSPAIFKLMNERELKEVELTNFNIDQRQTSFGKDYYIIFDNNENQAYFCFRGSDNLNHEEFELLSNEYMMINRIKLTYFEKEYQGKNSNKQVVSFKLPNN